MKTATTKRGEHKGKPVLVFLTNGQERARAYSSCRGLVSNCNRTYIEGCLSYHAVLEDFNYDLNNLGKKARYDVRSGLKNCQVKQLSFEHLALEGWLLQKDTMERQGRKVKAAEQSWKTLCRAADDLPGFEAWGALVQDRLAASLIAFRMGDCCYILFQQSLREFLPLKTNNTLSFVVTQTMLSRPGVKSIFYGLHSLDAPASVDEFKFRMGYRAKPVRQRVVFQPWLKPFFNCVSHAAVRWLLAWRPGVSTLAKAEGMMRFYREGKRPLTKQQGGPECLREMDLSLYHF